MNTRPLMRFGVLLAAWLMAIGSGPCAFFKPAEPERGGSGRPIPTDFSTPTAALGTLARGMEDKSGNGQNVYLSALAESTEASSGDGRGFHAFFDVRDMIEVPPHDPDWTRELEPSVYNLLVQRYSLPFEMTWEPYEPAGNETGTVDDSLLHRKYRIVAVSSVGNTITRNTIAVGAADLSFVKSQRDLGKWVIATWQDFRAIGSDSALVTLGHRRLESR